MSELFTRVLAVPSTIANLVREGQDWRYLNHRTGVTATLDGDGGLHVPLPRPSYWQLELTAAFQLSAEQLAALAAANARATRAEPARPWIEPARGEAWWRYLGLQQALRFSWPSTDVVIPDLALWRRREEIRVSRVLIWTDDQPALLVPGAADLVILKPSGRSPVGGSLPAGVVPIDRLLEAAGERLRVFEDPLPHWLYRGGSEHRPILDRLGQLATPARELCPVSLDELVDGPPAAAASA
jgi:hypothetical protein